MAEERTYICDVCGARKRSTDHWFLVLTGNRGVMVIDHEHAERHNFRVSAASPGILFPGMLFQDACGAECAIKKVSEHLDVAGPAALRFGEAASMQ